MKTKNIFHILSFAALLMLQVSCNKEELTDPDPADRFVGTYKGIEVNYSNANGNNTSQTYYNVTRDITKIDPIHVSINSTTISAQGAELYYDQPGQYNSVHITTLNDSLFIDVSSYSPGGSWGSHFRGKKQ